MKMFLNLAIIACLFFACTKNSSGPAQPGAIKGSVSDTNAVVRIIITSSDEGYFKAIESPVDNNFLFTDLLPGNYIIKVIPKLGYSATANAQITINNGETEDAGTFSLASNGQPKGLLQFSFYSSNFNFTNTDVKCAYVNDTLFINAQQPPTFPYWRFNFKIADVISKGTYNFNYFNRDSYINAYKVYSGSAMWFSSEGYNNDYNFGASATINVTTLDTANHIASGTFSGELMNMPFGGSNNSMKNGSFQLNY